jgi:hypothetical protein
VNLASLSVATTPYFGRLHLLRINETKPGVFGHLFDSDCVNERGKVS